MVAEVTDVDDTIMMMEACMATVTTGPASPIPLLVAPPPPSLSSVSTFHPTVQQPPSLISPMMSVNHGVIPSQHHGQPHHTPSFSSSCGSSSSTTGSISGGIGGGGSVNGGLGGGVCGDNSSGRCSSSSISGSNPRLNNGSLLCNKTPIQTIPPPMGSSSSVGLYQIHDGFATVRKRKGPSAAAIAMRQQEEIYDLAQPIPVPPVVPKVPFANKNGFSNGKPAGIKTRHSFLIGKSPTSTLISPTNSTGNSNGYGAKSASLLSTHPSLNLGKPKQHSTFSMNGTSSNRMVTSPVTSPSSLPPTGIGDGQWETVSGGMCPNPNCPGRPWPLSCDCRCSCSCTCTHRVTTHGQVHIIPSSSSSSSSTTSSIHKARMSSSKPASNSTTSLGRKLRRFVLPGKSSSNGGTAINSPSPPPAPSVHQFHSSFESVSPIPEPTLVPIRKSPSATAALGNGSAAGQYYQSVQQHCSFPSGDGQTGRLRNSISDNSIAIGLHRSSVLVPNNESDEVGVSVVTTPPTPPGSGGGSGGGGHSARHFHRSCFLPKAPPLEPVMEDGIPWRQTRKDVPWWEVAIRRGRYRSCPILQATPQVIKMKSQQKIVDNLFEAMPCLIYFLPELQIYMNNHPITSHYGAF